MCSFEKNDFLKIFSEEDALRRYVFNLISNRLVEITAKVEGIVLGTLENRLKDWILSQNKTIIYVTHEALANLIGSSREVVSRQLKRWEHEKSRIVSW